MNSATLWAPLTSVPAASFFRKSSTLETVRLNTATLYPWSFMFNTRFCPMTAKPIRPISQLPFDMLPPGDFATPGAPGTVDIQGFSPTQLMFLFWPTHTAISCGGNQAAHPFHPHLFKSFHSIQNSRVCVVKF